MKLKYVEPLSKSAFNFNLRLCMKVLETRLTARTDPNVAPSGGVFANITKEVASSATPSPAQWPGSELESRLQSIKRELDAYRGRDDKTLLGAAQLAWAADETAQSAAAGVAWQVFAQGRMVVEDTHTALDRR
jgi:hypothetical protein